MPLSNPTTSGTIAGMNGLLRFVASGLMMSATAVMAGGIGFRGDGTGAHPGANPPVQWDGEQESAYRWRARLPGFGYGCPIAVGGRVFAVTECDSDTPLPVLTCLDLKTGKELWRKELNHIPLLVKDPNQVKRLRQLWTAHLQLVGDINALAHRWSVAKDSGDKQRRLALKEDFRKLGFDVDESVLLGANIKKPPYDWVFESMIAGEPAASFFYKRLDKAHPELKEANLEIDARRRRGILNLLDTFPTPVSDGERIFIMNSYEAYWCLDLAGNVLWANAYRRDRGGSDDCQNGRSPIVWKDYFIADNRGHVRAFDRKTGKLAWDFYKHEHGAVTHEITSPVVVTVGGEDYVWVNAHPAHVLRCRDGKPYKLDGWNSPGMMVAVNTDQPDVVFITGGGEHGGMLAKGNGEEVPPAALRLKRAGDTMKAEILWMGIGNDRDGGRIAANDTTLAYHKGRLYVNSSRGGMILDPATGKILAGKLERRGRAGAAVPETAIALLFAADRVYGFGKTGGGKDGPQEGPVAKGFVEVYDLNGARLARNVVTAEHDPLGRNARFAATQHMLSYPYTFAIAGDALLFRDKWSVICVGR